MHVEVEAAAEALHESHRAEAGVGQAHRSGPGHVPALDGLRKCLHERAERGRVERGKLSKRVGQGQHPLAHGNCREHPVHQVGRDLVHASARAAGAHASSLAAESHEELVLAGLASGANKAVGEHAAAKVTA